MTAQRKSNLILGLCIIYLFSTAYIGGSAEPSFFYLYNVIFHLSGGVVLFILVTYCLAKIWKLLQVAGRVFLLISVLGLLLGSTLLITGATRPFLPLLYVHIGLSVAGPVALASWPQSRRILMTQFSFWVSMERLFHVALHSVWLAPTLGLLLLGSSDGGRAVENPIEVPLTMEEETGMPDGPFFPSAAETKSGNLIPADFFTDSESCGSSGCHPDIYKQWQSSVHHLASFNNQWYRKSVEYLQEVAGVQPAKWCGGCHDHALLFSGMMDVPIKELLDKAEAHAGLGCVSCHAITHVKNTMGNGGFIIEYQPLHDLATSKYPIVRGLYNYLTKVDPGPHRSIFLNPLHTEHHPEFCSSCHKVHMDVPVNNYRWIRGFNEYDAWQSSGVSGQSARAFYYPEKSMACNDCHMPLVPSNDAGNYDGLVHSHRFAAANTALPSAYTDAAQLQAVRQTLEGAVVSVDIFALGRGSSPMAASSALGEMLPDLLQPATTFPEPNELGVLSRRSPMAIPDFEIAGPIDAVQPVVRPGESVRIEVVVRTRTLGHFFPGGTVDGFDVWVELRAEDEQGRVIFLSGGVEEDGRGPVRPDAHFYRSLQLDGRGNPINKRNTWAARSLIYVRLIPPGAADSIHYRLDVSEKAQGKIKLTARVNYRKFTWWNTQWAYAGIRDPAQTEREQSLDYDDGNWIFGGDTAQVSGPTKDIPDLPIVVLAETEAYLSVAADENEGTGDDILYRKEDLLRWNDYGIGLLLQGDLKGAGKAFDAVTQIDPNYADGWVNLARVEVQQGNSTRALEFLEKAFASNPGLAKAHYFAGLAFKAQGNYEEALTRFRTVLESYPRDRVVLNQAGRALFLQHRYEEAVVEFHKSLRVDPENLQAHYNLMLCYRGLGDNLKAEREQKLYLRYKADEVSQGISGEYRRIHAEDNNERQQIHEHGSGPLPDENSRVGS